MKKALSKADIRADLEQAVDDFLRGGGQVENVPRGTSGIADRNAPPPYLETALFVGPRVPRTPVPEVVAAIEARRRDKPPRHTPRRQRKPEPRRKTLYDDFGEPLRRVWSDD